MPTRYHYQYRIREHTRYDGKQLYTVQWRSDWFGTRIFWLAPWYTAVIRNDTQLYFHDYVFDTLPDAICYLKERRKKDEEKEQKKERSVRTIKLG